jgi:hypothetical protein
VGLDPRNSEQLMQRCVARLVVAVLLGSEAPAAASSESDAEALIVRGVDLRRHGEHGAALELFEKAFEISPSGRALAQRGLAETSLRRWMLAERHLEAALARHDSPWIEARETRQVLAGALVGVRQHIGTVRIEGTPGTDVMVGDQPAGWLPLEAPVRAPEGETRIVGKLRGRGTKAVSVWVPGGGEITVRLEMGLDQVTPPRPVAGAAPAPVAGPRTVAAVPVARSTSVAAQSAPSAVVADAVSRSSETTPSPGRSGGFWAGSVLLAAGVGAATTGVVWLAVEGKGSCDGDRCIHLYDTRTQGWIAVASGATLALGGTALMFLSRTPNRTVALGVSPAGLLAVGRF